MISQLQALEKPTCRRATKRFNETDARLYGLIPDPVDYVPHPEYLLTNTAEELFGLDAPEIHIPPWRPSEGLDDDIEEVECSHVGTKLTRQDEALLFRRYNCARFHVASLMGKQAQRFSRGRVPDILMWYRRVLDNRDALTQANMALVVAMVKRTRITSVDFGDLVSEGNVALLHALDKFDFSRGFKFSTYACCSILRAFSRLASIAGTYRRRFPASFEPGMEQSDELARRHVDQSELAIENLQRVLRLNRAGLTDVEQKVLGARYAVAGHDRAHTLKEVSKSIRLSRERIRQIQNGLLVKLRLALERTFSPATTLKGDTQ